MRKYDEVSMPTPDSDDFTEESSHNNETNSDIMPEPDIPPENVNPTAAPNAEDPDGI